MDRPQEAVLAPATNIRLPVSVDVRQFDGRVVLGYLPTCGVTELGSPHSKVDKTRVGITGASATIVDCAYDSDRCPATDVRLVVAINVCILDGAPIARVGLPIFGVAELGRPEGRLAEGRA